MKKTSIILIFSILCASVSIASALPIDYVSDIANAKHIHMCNGGVSPSKDFFNHTNVTHIRIVNKEISSCNDFFNHTNTTHIRIRESALSAMRKNETGIFSGEFEEIIKSNCTNSGNFSGKYIIRRGGQVGCFNGTWMSEKGNTTGTMQGSFYGHHLQGQITVEREGKNNTLHFMGFVNVRNGILNGRFMIYYHNVISARRFMKFQRSLFTFNGTYSKY